MSATRLDHCDSFEEVRFRESIESLDEDASPRTAARKKYPWRRSDQKSMPLIKIDDRQQQGMTDGDASPVEPQHSQSDASTPRQPLHQSDISSAHHGDRPASSRKEDVTSEDSPDSRLSENDLRNEDDTTNHTSNCRKRRSKKSKDPELRPTTMSPDEQNNASQNGEDSQNVDGRIDPSMVGVVDSSELPAADSPSTHASSQPGDIHYSPDRDDALAHLVRMVASGDTMTDDDGRKNVPFEASASASDDSLSAYQDADEEPPDEPLPCVTSSSGDVYSADFEDASSHVSSVLQEAAMAGLEFDAASGLEFDDETNNTRTMSLQAAMMVGDDRMSDGAFPDADAAQVAARNFAMEHRIFMKALLELLDQRERYSAEVDMNDKETIKSGVLKKESHLGVWKVKYVEVRRGAFSYYEDAKDSEEGTLVRKNIALHADTCSCRAVKVQHKKALSVAPGGAIFELKIEGGPKRLWMANSREERLAWIRAINAATLGKSVTRGESFIEHMRKCGTISDESPYKHDLEMYVKIQRDVQFASSKEQYLGTLSELVGQKLNVPVQWIRQQMGGVSTERPNNAFHEEAVSRSVSQLWKDLLRDSVRVDYELFLGGSGHAPERIIAALMRCIMEYDKSSPLSANASDAQKNKYYISESQALSYARDILLSGNRTRSGGDSYYCVNTLCKSPELAVTVPSSQEAEPWNISMSHIQPEKRGRGDSYYSMNELSGWLRTRRRPQKPWKKRYFVLSEGTLSHFEKALPRPRGLRGQIAVTDATISVAGALKPDGKKGSSPKVDGRKSLSPKQSAPASPSNHFVVSILGKDGRLERQILFQDVKKFILWTHALEAYSVDDEIWQSNHSVSKVKGMFQKLREEITGTQDPIGDFVLGHKSLKENADELGLDKDEIADLIANVSNSGANGRATVMVSVEAATDYKICTVDPQGDDKEDTWSTIRAVFQQNFRLSGGHSGRIVRGEEIVQINVMDCNRPEHVHASENAFANPENVSPLALFRTDRLKGFRTRRTMSS